MSRSTKSRSFFLHVPWQVANHLFYALAYEIDFFSPDGLLCHFVSFWALSSHCLQAQLSHSIPTRVSERVIHLKTEPLRNKAQIRQRRVIKKTCHIDHRSRNIVSHDLTLSNTADTKSSWMTDGQLTSFCRCTCVEKEKSQQRVGPADGQFQGGFED